MDNSVAMFYFPQNRAWELLAGAFIARILYTRGKLKTPIQHATSALTYNTLSCAGTLCIIVAVTTLKKTSVFPGWLALIPTLGACLVIASGGDTWLNRHLFANRFMVFIGLISYPLYLWHWPLLAFARIMENQEPSTATRGLCVAISFVLAWFTYRFVERPLRVGGKHIITLLLLGGISIGITGYLCAKETLKPRSALYGLEKIIKAVNDWGYPTQDIIPFHYRDVSFESQGHGKKATVFLGDSNMEQYLPRINKILTENPEAYNRVIFGTYSACAPIRHVINTAFQKCPSVINNAYQFALENPDVDTVVIGALWIQYFNLGGASNTLFYDDNGRHHLMGETESPGAEKAFVELEAMITALQHAGKKVFIILNIPSGGEFDPRQLVVRSWSSLGFGLTRDYSGVEKTAIIQRIGGLTGKLKDIAERTNSILIDPVELICSEKHCPATTTSGFPIYRDGYHLNATYVKDNLFFLDQTVMPH